MAKLILKWRYFKSGTPRHGEHYVKYIATREGVEKCDESWKYEPPTDQQLRLIKDILKDFPQSKDCFEYQDYTNTPTKASASEFISRALEDHMDMIGKKENYVAYIARRPRVEREGSHGLFTQTDQSINLSEVARTVAQHEGNVFTMVVSLRREDAERLGYDHAKAWRDMLRSQAPAIAKEMKIPLKDLRWYAAFHNEGYHPHIHLVAYSVGDDPYMTKQGLNNLKAAFGRVIFKNDLYETYAHQTEYRDNLRDEARDHIQQLVADLNGGIVGNETVERLLRELAKELQGYKGKRVYGYLPKHARNLINAIIDEMEKDPRIAELYNLWYQQKENITGIYQDTPPPRVPLSKNKEFHPIRNAVLKEAFFLSKPQVRTDPLDLFSTPDTDSEDAPSDTATTSSSQPQSNHDEDEENERTDQNKRYASNTMLALSAARLFARLSQMIQDKSRRDGSSGRTTDKKLRQKINQKKQDQGQKLGG